MIQINAKLQKLQFVKNDPAEYRYVMHVNQYSKLSESKVPFGQRDGLIGFTDTGKAAWCGLVPDAMLRRFVIYMIANCKISRFFATDMILFLQLDAEGSASS